MSASRGHERQQGTRQQGTHKLSKKRVEAPAFSGIWLPNRCAMRDLRLRGHRNQLDRDRRMAQVRPVWLSGGNAVTLSGNTKGRTRTVRLALGT
jgi:hypothetical protein